MAEVYQLDDIVFDFLNNVASKDKFKALRNIINNINLLNSLPDFDIEYDLNELESKIIDIIQQTGDNTDKVTLITETIKSEAISYIENIGIILIEDRDEIYLYHISNILFGLYNMFNANVTGAEFIIESLRDENNDMEVNIAELLEEYTSIRFTEYVDIVEDVKDTLVTYMLSYFSNVLKNYDPKLDEETNNGIKKLLKVDLNFNKTDVVKDMLRLGLKPNLFANNLNNLYFNLNKYADDIDMVPYEIAATLFLCDDSENHMLVYLEEEVQFELIDFVSDNENLKNDLIKQTKELINKINGIKLAI